MYFIANWKMFGDLRSLNSLDSVIKFSKNNKNTNFRIIYCPPNTLIRPLSKRLKKTNLEVGAQNCHESENYGAFTGHVNSKMLKNVGAKYVILGHSERRSLYHENNASLANKVNTSIESGMEIVFCFGEQLEERKSNRHFDVVKEQLSEALFSLSAASWSQVVLAYEPVWAIGTGKSATAEEAEAVHKLIRNRLAEESELVGEKVRILYGGSVKPENAKALFAMKNIDGALVGGASLDANAFLAICDAAAR